ncbi:unnamed protein product [Vicia faba]|uniref:Transcription initiation factor IIA gamma subunit N-terminal domain-containing protein n=1 Tax=Vicia faba TaxID=3906 RepID=A0AAV0Z031_VICFA|nr:unnamed protein product [Vicia faba]
MCIMRPEDFYFPDMEEVPLYSSLHISGARLNKHAVVSIKIRVDKPGLVLKAGPVEPKLVKLFSVFIKEHKIQFENLSRAIPRPTNHLLTTRSSSHARLLLTTTFFTFAHRVFQATMVTFELYRRSTIRLCLLENLDEMVDNGTLSPELAIQVLLQLISLWQKL